MLLVKRGSEGRQTPWNNGFAMPRLEVPRYPQEGPWEGRGDLCSP